MKNSINELKRILDQLVAEGKGEFNIGFEDDALVIMDKCNVIDKDTEKECFIAENEFKYIDFPIITIPHGLLFTIDSNYTLIQAQNRRGNKPFDQLVHELEKTFLWCNSDAEQYANELVECCLIEYKQELESGKIIDEVFPEQQGED